MSTVNIDRIDLSLRGVPTSTAQSAIAALGPALSQALAAQPVPSSTAAATLRVERVEATPIRVSASASSSELTAALARQIATAVHGQIATKTNL